MDINYVYHQLNALGYAISQVQFSELWLGRSKRYYSHLIATDREPGLGTLAALSLRLQRTLAATQGDETEYLELARLNRELSRHIEIRSSLSAKALRRTKANPLNGKYN